MPRRPTRPGRSRLVTSPGRCILQQGPEGVLVRNRLHALHRDAAKPHVAPPPGQLPPEGGLGEPRDVDAGRPPIPDELVGQVDVYSGHVHTSMRISAERTVAPRVDGTAGAGETKARPAARPGKRGHLPAVRRPGPPEPSQRSSIWRLSRAFRILGAA